MARHSKNNDNKNYDEICWHNVDVKTFVSDVVEPWEAILTFFFFFAIIITAYLADKRLFYKKIFRLKFFLLLFFVPKLRYWNLTFTISWFGISSEWDFVTFFGSTSTDLKLHKRKINLLICSQQGGNNNHNNNDNNDNNYYYYFLF